MRTEEIPMEKCEFLDCVPDLHRFSTEGYMEDEGCMKFAQAAATKNIPSLIFVVLIFSLAFI